MASRVGLGVDRAHGRGDHVLVSVVDRGEHVAGQVDLAALPRRAGEHAGDRRLQAGVRVGDHEAHTGQSSISEGAQERGPEHFVFGVADVDAEHLAVAVDGDRGGHDDGA